MDVKNRKVYMFLIIIFIWSIFSYYLENIIGRNIINYLFWIINLIFCFILFNNEYKRDKYKSIVFKDVVMFVLIYLIIYYLSGLLFGFKKSPLNFSLYNIARNLLKFVLIRGIIETVKYYLIKENNTKIFLIILTIIFIVVNIDISYLNIVITNNRELFKYISSNIIPLIMYQSVGTYLIKSSDLKTNLILQLMPIILSYTIPLSPNLDWYLYGVFHIVYLLIIYLFIKYEIEKREVDIKKANDSVLSLFPVIIPFTILILFVLGVFNYVPIGVMSNSMKPIFERGDIIIYQKLKSNDNIRIDDIICYQLDDIKVMHRVVKIVEIDNKKYFITKGDNLKTNDPLKVSEDQVVGKIKFTIPRLGYPSVWLYEVFK